MNESQYQCPKCGRWGDEDSLVERSEPEYSHVMAMQFGGTPMYWDEKHKCPTCDTEFEFENGNC